MQKGQGGGSIDGDNQVEKPNNRSMDKQNNKKPHNNDYLNGEITKSDQKIMFKRRK